MQYGVPVIVATDVSPPPGRVVKIASAFGARLWHPERDLSVAYKEEVVRRFSYGKNAPSNDHERDALAAAFAAFSMFSPKFRQIERRLREENRLEDEDIVKRAVVFGQSVDRALSHRQERRQHQERKLENKKGAIKTSAIQRAQPSLAAELRKRIEIQSELIEELRQQVHALKKELKKALSEREKEIRKDALVQRLNREKKALLERLREKEAKISSLEQEVQTLRRIIEGIAKGTYVILPSHQAALKDVPVVLSLGEYAVVEKEEWEKRDPEAFAERLERMIQEYRRARADKI